MRFLLLGALLGSVVLVGCGDSNASLANEKSPSASPTDKKTTGPAQVKVEMGGAKMKRVGDGDGLMKVDSK